MRSATSRVLLLLALLVAASAPARTITLNPDAVDAFAALCESHPRSGWAAHQVDPSLYISNPPIGAPNTSFLIRYSFDQIPKGNRITHAEWTIPAGPAATATVTIWRVLADWGIGRIPPLPHGPPQKARMVHARRARQIRRSRDPPDRHRKILRCHAAGHRERHARCRTLAQRRSPESRLASHVRRAVHPPLSHPRRPPAMAAPRHLRA